MPVQWKPLFEGDAAQPFRAAIEDIQNAVDAWAVDANDWGRPLLHMYQALDRDGQPTEQCERLVDQAAAMMESARLRPALYMGVAGVGWLYAHSGRLLGTRSDDDFSDVDDFLELAAQRLDASGAYDLIGGPVGIGVYFIERLPAAGAIEGLKAVINLLEATSEISGSGTTWFTPPEQLPPWQREIAPQGYYNLGVAHGVAGIVGLLGLAVRSPALRDCANDLLRRSLNWLLAQQLEAGMFPSWIAVGMPARPSRVAWCYGELGVAVCILQAACALNDTELRDRAIHIAIQAAKRRFPADHRIVDAGICHGAAGNAHIFNRLYQCTGVEDFRDAALFWYGLTLAMKLPGEGVGGYRAWRSQSLTDASLANWEDDPTFLTGASGIALALLAAISPIEPSWDRVMLLDVPPGGAC